MNLKRIGAASALTLGRAICGAAAAQTAVSTGSNASAIALGASRPGRQRAAETNDSLQTLTSKQFIISSTARGRGTSRT